MAGAVRKLWSPPHRYTALVCLVWISLSLSGCSGGSGAPFIPDVDLEAKIIVAFGDSITAGFGDSSYPSAAAGYPFRLEQALQVFFPNAIVLNRGVGGEVTTRGLQRLRFILSHDRPDYVLLLEGYNDIRDGALDWTPEIIQNLELMIFEIRAAGAVPLMASLTPTTGLSNYKNGNINSLHPKMAGLAARHSVVFVDLFEVFLEEPDYTILLSDDGLHPNENGYDLIAGAWFDALLGEL